MSSGESDQVVAYPRNSQPDVWVMQQGVANMHMASSYLWDWKVTRIAALPDVAKATPILYQNASVKIGTRNWFAYIVGLPSQSARGGPWRMQSGRAQPSIGEAVIPAIIAAETGVSIGDEIQITDRHLRIIGLSEETFSMANSVIFVAFDDLEKIASAAGTVSYVLVDAKPGVDAANLAQHIMAEVEKVNALTQQQFISNDYDMAVQMGVDILYLMNLICSALAGLIVAYTGYTLVANRRRELTIAKAVGMPRRALLGAVILQAGSLALLGFALAALLSWPLLPVIKALVPQVTLLASSSALLETALAALLVATIGALLPAYRVLQLDPAIVFKE
ncbi:MAG: FtsX-like permease family protein [Hahellaceae bacterium]|nr:FtsX-like permease family protein [Hahellaceae bacterium]MCP5168369.1 FtsX-like permease family protein [Hahellaceae bacterium]